MQFIHFSPQTGPTTIPDEIPSLFDGSMGHMKDTQIKLHTDPSFLLTTHQCIPFHIHKDHVKKKLDCLEKMDVLLMKR